MNKLGRGDIIQTYNCSIFYIVIIQEITYIKTYLKLLFVRILYIGKTSVITKINKSQNFFCSGNVII
ncbi:hypothetical protein pb186bvf_005256 [Paramecium bursaria]